MSDKEHAYHAQFLSEDDWQKLTPEKQLETDQDRVTWDLIRQEQQYAESRVEREKWPEPKTPEPKSEESLPGIGIHIPTPEPSQEIEQAQVTPSRAASPDVTNEMPAFELTEDSVDEDFSSIEVNYHDEGYEWDPSKVTVTWDPINTTHRAPLKAMKQKGTRFFGTHNDQTNIQTGRLIPQLAEMPNVEYMIICKEIAPTTFHVHFHSLVIFKEKVPLTEVYKLDPRGVWEIAKGRLHQAYDYVVKDGHKIHEHGVMPMELQMHLEKREQKERKKSAPTKSEVLFNEMVARAKSGDKSIRWTQIYARYRMYFDDILASVHEDKIFDGELTEKNTWIYGPAGTGKSKSVWDRAREEGKRVYCKNGNKWWDGFDGQEIVLIDDLGENAKALVNHIKNWADRYPFTAEVKGGTRRINACEFELIITSNYTPEQLFEEADVEPIKRRFNVIQMV